MILFFDIHGPTEDEWNEGLAICELMKDRLEKARGV